MKGAMFERSTETEMDEMKIDSQKKKRSGRD